MSSLSLSRISKSYGSVPVVRDVSLEVQDGEFLTLVGPSGCGKSTLLRIIAGLEPQDHGSVSIDGMVVDGVRPKSRDVAMVFQSYALYPHMTVAKNIGLPLRMRRLNSLQRIPVGRLLPSAKTIVAGIDQDVRHVAQTLRIEHLLNRKPGELSGGQRQRVALGRAMVRQPAVFLMDEPLSNLDAKLRVEMRLEIKELHRKLGATFVYVTHDQEEAMTMSDRVAVMKDGRLLQVSSPRTLYELPEALSVAEFVGSPRINRLRGRLKPGRGVELNGDVLISQFADLKHRPSEEEITIGLRPEHFVLHRARGPGSISGRIKMVENIGPDLYVHFAVDNQDDRIIVRASPDQTHMLHIGLETCLHPIWTKAHIFCSEGHRIDYRGAHFSGTPAARQAQG